MADPRLGSDLDVEQLALARERLVLPQIELEPGAMEISGLAESEGVRGHVHGFLVLRGALTINLCMSARRCARLIGLRELVLLDGMENDSIPVTWDWSVLTETRLAVFDDRLMQVAQQWPVVMSAILKRAAQQTRQAFLQQAISQLPRVEERLLALFWTIADRQGVVRGDGVWVELAVTHETLAEMIGAQRPTVSLGLTRLAESGLLLSLPAGWRINPASLEEFPMLRHQADDARTSEMGRI